MKTPEEIKTAREQRGDEESAEWMQNRKNLIEFICEKIEKELILSLSERLFWGTEYESFRREIVNEWTGTNTLSLLYYDKHVWEEVKRILIKSGWRLDITIANGITTIEVYPLDPLTSKQLDITLQKNNLCFTIFYSPELANAYGYDEEYLENRLTVTGVKRFTKLLHREDGPAYIERSGIKEYFINGEKIDHPIDKPLTSKPLYINSRREDLRDPDCSFTIYYSPELAKDFGWDEEYLQYKVKKYGTSAVEHLLHREDGPAIIGYEGNENFFVRGEWTTYLKFCPACKHEEENKENPPCNICRGGMRISGRAHKWEAK